MCYVPRHGEHARGSVAAVARTFYVSWKVAASKLISQSPDLFYILWEKTTLAILMYHLESSFRHFLSGLLSCHLLDFCLLLARGTGNVEFYCFCGIARNLPGFIFSQCAASEDKTYSKSLVHVTCHCMLLTPSLHADPRSTAWQCWAHSWLWQSSGAVCRTGDQTRFVNKRRESTASYIPQSHRCLEWRRSYEQPNLHTLCHPTYTFLTLLSAMPSTKYFLN